MQAASVVEQTRCVNTNLLLGSAPCPPVIPVVPKFFKANKPRGTREGTGKRRAFRGR